MKKDDFNSIIDFAVEREKEAVEFYKGLQSKAKFTEMIEMLKELETMEQGHINMLEQIRSKGIEKIEVQEVQDLHIGDYMVAAEPSEDMDYQDILIIAMKREEKSKELYTDLAKRFAGSEVEKVLLKIAAEETDHKLKFERLYDENVLKEN